MGTHTIYRPLCHINLWHAYDLHPADAINNELPVVPDQVQAIESRPETYSVLRDLSFAPTADSRRLMKDRKMQFQQHNTGFTIWIRAKATSGGSGYIPFVPLDTDLKLIIPFRLENNSFVNFTNIGMSAPRQAVYYFSNKAGNPYPDANGPIYLFLNDSRDPPHYISEDDRLPMHAHVRTIDVEGLQLKFIRVEISSRDDPTRQFSECLAVQNPEDFLGECKVNLQHLPPGIYELNAYTLMNGAEEEIPGLRETFYRNNGSLPADAFGVIELFHLADGSLGEYSLLDAQGELPSPTYTLWWQNRMTTWRYLFNHAQPEPDDASSDVKFEGADKKKLITKAEQPLVTRRRKIRYTINGSDDAEEFALPNPAADRIYPDETNRTIYAEIHMGNINFNKI